MANVLHSIAGLHSISGISQYRYMILVLLVLDYAYLHSLSVLFSSDDNLVKLLPKHRQPDSLLLLLMLEFAVWRKSCGGFECY